MARIIGNTYPFSPLLAEYLSGESRGWGNKRIFGPREISLSVSGCSPLMLFLSRAGGK